jgi:hypothetical protein
MRVEGRVLGELPSRVTRHASRIAFSLIEIMVVVALLSVIVLGLMAMFTQTQRAFRTGMAQTDVLESGRMATDLLARELEQITPCFLYRTNTQPNGVEFPIPNFEAEAVFCLVQPMPGSPGLSGRTNVMSDVFFMIRQNQTWTGIGYFVRTNRFDEPSLPGGRSAVGTLFRFETNNTIHDFERNPGGLYAGFNNVRSQTVFNNVSRILDGVIAFRIRPFDLAGWVLTNNPSYVTNFNPQDWANLPALFVQTNLIVNPNFPASGEIGVYSFFSNAVPAAVEVELGILEQQAYDHYKSMPTDFTRYRYLTNLNTGVLGKMHLFRQHISVRNVDPSAYR